MVEQNFEDINFEKVDALVAKGKLFRAKETLHGMAGSYGFHPEIFCKLAYVLEAMKEPEIASRFHFYSGKRDSNSAEPTQLYREFLKNQLKRNKSFSLFSDIPKTLKRAHPAKFPSTLRKDLQELGVLSEDLDNWLRFARTKENPVLFAKKKTFAERLKLAFVITFGFAIFFLFVALATLVGKAAFVAIKTLWN